MNQGVLGLLAFLVIAFIGTGAHATPAHHTIDKVTKTRTGATIHVLMRPAPGYSQFSLGVTAHTGSRGSPQQLPTTGNSASVSEVTLHIPYGTAYKTGQQLRVISSWPAMGRIHYWGRDQTSIVTLP